MRWDKSKEECLDSYCQVQGLRASTVRAYWDALNQYTGYMEEVIGRHAPEEVSIQDVFSYIDYLREERRNGASAINRAIAVLKKYYRTLVGMEYIDRYQNPMLGFPRIKPARRKFPEVLTTKEIKRLINAPRKDTVMGIRDRTLLVLLLCTGIRANECACLRDKDVRLDEHLIRVIGKGGDERTVPLEKTTAQALRVYRKVRGEASPESRFFRSRKGGGLSRHGIYSRVLTYARKARIKKRVTPHILRHTFATHMMRKGTKLTYLKEILGHRQLASTEVYLHMTAADIRAAMEKHPLKKIAAGIVKYLPNVKIRFQYPPGTRFAFNST